jgi:hypothetical protein
MGNAKTGIETFDGANAPATTSNLTGRGRTDACANDTTTRLAA